MNIGRYIGIPYSLRPMAGCVNCWSLVALIYSQEMSKDIPEFKSKGISGIASAFTAAFATGEHGFKKVASVKNFDVMVFINKSEFRSEYHCGIHYNGKVLHAVKALGGVVYQDVSVAMQTFDKVEFWRL